MPIDLAMQNLMKTTGEQGIRSFEQMGVTQACDFAATFVDQQARHVVYSGTTAVQTAVLTSLSSLARVPHPRRGHRRRSDPRAVPDPGPHRGRPPSPGWRTPAEALDQLLSTPIEDPSGVALIG